ncbi:predicted protein, partial [Postia placenta Mad-698-R]
MPTQMLGRPIIKKQTGYSLYRPSAIAIANTLADIPFSAVKVFIYNIIIYFMSGLARNGGGFWTFHLFVYLAFLTMQGFFRSFGFMCSNFDAAFRLATFFLPNMILYVGYMIPVFQMKRWLFWIYYINPLAYAWSGITENEFGRISLACDGSYIVPRNPPGVNKYPDGVGPNQICTLYGASAGQNSVAGRAYIDSGYGIDTDDLWRRNFLVLLGFFFLFQLTQVLLVEYYPQYFGSSGATVYAPEDDNLKALNAVLKERKAHREANRGTEDVEAGVSKE